MESLIEKVSTYGNKWLYVETWHDTGGVRRISVRQNRKNRLVQIIFLSNSRDGNERRKHSSNQDAENECQQKSDINIMGSHKNIMEITYQLSLALLTVFGLVAAGMALSARHRDVALWLGFAAAVMGVLSFFAWLQDNLWKQDSEIAKEAGATVKRPRILFVENKLILPTNENDPLRITFGLMNTGDADATVKIKDRTYYFSTDPAQNVFKYQPSPPEEILVSAISNAIWRGEMRFNLRLTSEKLAALGGGKARLFFFARVEYSDEAGKTYPLTFAEMYDPLFHSHLVSCPKGVVFE